MALRAAHLRRLRLSSGLILFGYLVTHFANHALGLVSLAAMEIGRDWFIAFWRHPFPTTALYGALVTHAALALWSLYQRQTLRMPAWEATQLVLGLTIPPLLAPHVIGTRLSHELFGVDDSYTRVVFSFWQARPELGLRQSVLLVIAWVHACIGLHFWLRLRPWYPRTVALFFAGALLLPVLALLGFTQAGREVSARAQQPGWVDSTLRATDPRSPTDRAWLGDLQVRLSVGLVAAVGIVLVARAARGAYRRRQDPLVRVVHPDGRSVVVPRGFTVLEASRFAGIPHASVCGGRGRCSTCRVRIVRGLRALPPASPEEQRVLQRVSAPPNVRLACQLRPTADVAVVPLVPPTAPALEALARPGRGAGDEQEIAVLFADLRGFTTLAEHRLPFDVVFFLNRYFAAVGSAIEKAGGIVNQFTGDGVMALFGVDATAEDGCRRALAAAVGMRARVAELSRMLADELGVTLQIGIGIHTGAAFVGEMGYSATTYLTAVGDTVHVASRLQDLTKEYRCELVVSEQVGERAGYDLSAFARHEITVRNRREPLAIRVVPDVGQLGVAAPARSPAADPSNSWADPGRAR